MCIDYEKQPCVCGTLLAQKENRPCLGRERFKRRLEMYKTGQKLEVHVVYNFLSYDPEFFLHCSGRYENRI